MHTLHAHPTPTHPGHSTNDGEFVAFTAYACAFAPAFLALVDTYDTLQSGVVNFLALSAALHEIEHKSLGVRLDSGDLPKLSLGLCLCVVCCLFVFVVFCFFVFCVLFFCVCCLLFLCVCVLFFVFVVLFFFFLRSLFVFGG